MDVKQLRKSYDLLLKDIDFDRLDLDLKKPNIFQVLRITNTEIRHSNFLAWILDPNANHKLGDAFLKRFLREVFISNKVVDIDQVDVEGLNLNTTEILREWEHIDLLIKIDDLVVCVENKVYTKEHSNQLQRYKKIIENTFPSSRKAYVYLTVDGQEPENETDHYEPISYEFIVDTLENIIGVYKEFISEQVLVYLNDYVKTIRRDIMKSDELTELSRKIYKNHKELLDFIFEHKPDPIDRLRGIFQERIKARGWIVGSENKYYVRFLTNKTQPYVYYNKTIKNGWKLGESFLFEIVMYPSSNNLKFQTVISPSDDNYDSGELEKILLKLKGSQSSKGSKWLVNYTKKDRLKYDDIESIEDDDIRSLLDKFLDKIEPVVCEVEELFAQYKDNLQTLKN